jgi:uncharacterized protein YidB (DUF937 family)
MDLSQIMKLAQDPQMQQLLKGLLSQVSKGGGGQANLQGLVSQLQGSGMADQVQSWVQQGPNQPVTGKQIQDALGTGTLDQLASQAGMPPEKAADDLAEVLPVIVDKATPQGQLPAAAPAGADIDALLKQLLGGLSQPKA